MHFTAGGTEACEGCDHLWSRLGGLCPSVSVFFHLLFLR